MYAQPNEHGAYMPDQCDVIEIPSGNRSEVKIMLAHTGPDTWTYSTIVHIVNAGWGGYPGCIREKYPTRQAALAAAYADIIDSCKYKIQQAGTQAQAQSAKKVIRAVKAHKKAQKQMTLF
jgi:hypothetical protein